MPRMNKAYKSIGGLANAFLHGKKPPMLPVGMRGPAALRLGAMKKDIAMGKKIVGTGIGLGALGIVNRQKPVGGYNPRRPVMPVPQNGRPM